MAKRINAITTTATSPASDDYLPIDGATNNTRKILASNFIGPKDRNALAPRGGLLIEGSVSGANITAPIPAFSTTDDFTILGFVRFPSSLLAVSQTIFNLSSSSTGFSNTGFRVGFNGSSDIRTDTSLGFAGLITTGSYFAGFAGKWVHLALVRSGSGQTLTLYVNGTQVITSTNANAAVAMSGWYLSLGRDGNNYLISQGFSSVALAQFAMSAADVLEAYESGGVPPRMRLQTAAPAEITPTGKCFSVGASDANVATPWNGGWSISAAAGTRTGGAGSWIATGSVPNAWTQCQLGSSAIILNPNKTYKVSFWARASASVVTSSNVNVVTKIPQTSLPANTWVNIQMVISGVTAAILGFEGQGVFTLDLDDISIIETGAAPVLPLTDGVGRQHRDDSNLKLHAIRSASGVSDLIERDEAPYVQLALTANGELLDTAGALRTDAVLVDVVVKNTTANAVAGFGLGMASGVIDLTLPTDIPGNSTVILHVTRSDLAGLTVGTSPYGRIYYAASSWNSGSLNLSIRYRRERDL